MQRSRIKKVNIALIFVTGFKVLFFVSFLLPISGTVVGNARDNLASVIGVSAGVLPNKYNTLAQQLEETKQELDKREQKLIERKASLEVRASEGNTAQNKTVLYGIAISSVLFILVVINFYLDWRRRRKFEI